MTYKKCMLCNKHILTAGKNVPKDDTKYLCLSCLRKIDDSKKAFLQDLDKIDDSFDSLIGPGLNEFRQVIACSTVKLEDIK